jgi:ComF family protein
LASLKAVQKLTRDSLTTSRKMGKLKTIVRHISTGIINLLYPANCFSCRSETNNPGLCPQCINALKPVKAPFCSCCGQPCEGEISGQFHCSNCSGQAVDFEFAIAAYLARGCLREMIHDFKYHRRIAMRKTLAQLAENALDDPRIGGGKGWLLVPVPLHRRRKRERGYNQATEIATAISRRRNLPICRALKRIRYTSSQAQLLRSERLGNLRGAFEMRPSPAVRAAIKGSQILLIDDIFTTGATANACARVLRAAGQAEKVVVATVARG